MFVTDFKGNQLTDVKFNFYKFNSKTRNIKKVTLNPKLNSKTKVFELDADKSLFDYIVVREDS
jgi:hypothetical protein